MTGRYAFEPDDTRERRWTGWTVLLTLLGFFGVVFAINGVMIFAAISTMRGLDTESAYQAGRMFERDVAMAKAQDARQWQVDAKVTTTPGGGRRLDVVARDASGRPLGGLALSAVFERPTDRRLDQAVAVAEVSPGTFYGNSGLAAGQWDLVIELSRQGEEMFRSRNRVVLK